MVVDPSAGEWKYVWVRRLDLLIKDSLYRGPQRAVFEPNDGRLSVRARLAIAGFMQSLWRTGAFTCTKA